MANDPKLTIQRALENYRGDDLYRARVAFQSITGTKRMDEEYGVSGKTPNQILAEYEQHEAEVNAAVKWLESK